MLILEKLSRRFGATLAVDNVGLCIDPGSFIGVIGRSGAGKSTLLRMVNRLLEPTGGRVVFDGIDITALRGQALRNWRAQAAMIFQQFNLAGRLDVLTNVLMGRLNKVSQTRSLLRLWSAEDKVIAMSALELLDIAHLAGQRADTLSGGQQQRVAIARALVQDPDIILADEPVASLDPRNAKVVMDALLRVNKHFGISIVCNLHDLEVARSYCDRLVGMGAGRLVFDGAPSTLTSQAAHDLYGLEASEAIGPEAAAPQDSLVIAPVAA